MRIALFNVPYLESFGWMKRSAPNYVPLSTACLAAYLKKETRQNHGQDMHSEALT